MEPDCLFLGGRAYYAVSTPALLLLAGLSYAMAAVVLRGYGMHTGGDLVSVSIELNGISISGKALRDTGNVLRDPVSGQSIPIASWQVLSRLLPDEVLRQADFTDPSDLLQRLQHKYPHLVRWGCPAGFYLQSDAGCELENTGTVCRWHLRQQNCLPTGSLKF